MTQACPELIYIHGFTSSPLSQKAEATRQFIAERELNVTFRCPHLSEYPEAAIARVAEEIGRCATEPVLIGSSMGGFYATHLSETRGLRSVLVNPAVKPHRLIAHYLGPNENPYTGETFILTERDLEKLRELDLPIERCRDLCMVLLETGDETLDYRDALALYEGVPTIVEQGGDHRCQSYERYLPLIFESLGLPT